MEGVQLAERYELGERLGEGGMGVVYRATDLRTGGPVAVKLLPPSLAHSATARQRLQREAHLAAGLVSPRVVRVLDLFEHQGAPVLVMEYVAGETLADLLRRRGRLPVWEAIDLAREVARALVAAHARGVIHRDLKPANIKLVEGQVKVLDFGIARLGAGDGRSASTGYLGTPEYSAPEQAEGQADERTDVYALGVVLYELLRGQPPFRGPTPFSVLRQHVEAPVPPLPADVPEAVGEVVARCLAKDPARRYQSAAEVEEALGLLERRLESSRSGVLADTLDLPPGDGATARHNLPAQLSSFVGREQELAAVRQNLATSRLVTLTGPGGVGKTRLALATAATLVGSDFEDGVMFVDLAPLRDPDLVIVSIAQALGVREGVRPLLDVVVLYLRERHALLLLDNFEHVLAAASVIASLLERCPRLVVLATSRAPLRLHGEQVYPVPPLGLPDLLRPSSPGALADVPSVSLFMQRARAAKVDFSLTDTTARTVGEICARLDGLPLAIELAAARVRVLSPQGILARLGNRLALLTGGQRNQPLRHQTLRTAIDWSYELLPEAEQVLFRRLAVFSGGCTVEAVEAICLADGDPKLDVLDGLTTLLECSLLWQTAQDADGQPRFGMLETIREYALDRLRESGELEAVAARHATFFVGVAERAEPELRGPEQAATLERLAADNDNLRAALDWAAESGDVDKGLRIGGALWRFWQIRGEYAEPRARLERLLRLTAATPTREYAQALACTGRLVYFQGDHEAARPLLEASLSIQRELDERAGMAFTLVNLSLLAAIRDEDELALRLAEEAVAVARAGGGEWVLTSALALLATLVHLDGDSGRGQRLCEEALAITRRLGDQRSLANALLALAAIVHGQGDARAALPMLEEAMLLLRRLDDRGWLPCALAQLGLADLDAGDRAGAVAHLEECLAVARESGSRPGIALALEGFACLLAGEGRVQPARRLAGAAARLREVIRVRGPAPTLALRQQVEGRLAPLHLTDRNGAQDAPPDFRQAILEALALASELRPSSRRIGASQPGAAVQLSSREQEVVALVRQGLTSRQIADVLVVSERTVNTHLEHIRQKLGVRSRAEIVARTIGSTAPAASARCD